MRAWAHAKVISFYGHGNHVLMGRRAKYPGPQLQLGTGDVLRMASLQDATYGLDRVELWACRSGLDFPWDPMFPVHEGFGFDYELISSGVRATIGTLWSVDELTTSLVVLRYRKALREGRDPAAALVEAQRWWRDVAQPRFVADEDFTAVTIELWRSVLAGQAAPDEASVRAWLTATSRDPDRRAALIESLRSPIAHAAYRFSGLQHTPAERLEAQAAPARPAPQRGIVRLTIGELRVQPIPRPPPFATEVGGFIDDRTNWIGVVTKDKVDGDFTFIVLEIEDGEYRMLHMEDSYEDEAAAFRDLERFLTEGARNLAP